MKLKATAPAELLLLFLLLSGVRAAATEEARTISRENAAFDADLLYRELTSAGELVLEDADVEGNW